MTIAAIAIYLSFRNLACWKKLDLSTLKAKVFLDSSFLKYDFKLTIIMVALLSFHFITEYMELEGVLPQYMDIACQYSLPLVLLILVLIQYKWYTLLHKKMPLKN